MPQIFRIECNARCNQHPLILFLKSFGAMMLFLILNVTLNILYMARTDTEHAISRLPAEVIPGLTFQPFRRFRFDFFQKISNRRLSAEIYEKMNVIRHATFGNQTRFEFFQNRRDVSRKFRVQLSSEKWLSMLCAEYNVEINRTVRLCHYEYIALSGLQTLFGYVPRVAFALRIPPWAASTMPFHG